MTAQKSHLPQLASALGLWLLFAGTATSAASTQAELPPVATVPATQSKKPISHDVYANWRSIAGSVLSNDGKWAAWALQAQENDGEVVAKNLADGREWRSPRGTAPVFSADGRYLAFAIKPTQAELDLAKKNKKKGDDAPKPGVGIMDLATGKVESIARIKRFSWPERGASWLAVALEAPKDGKKAVAKPGDKEEPKKGAAKKKEPGTELLLIDVANGKRHKIEDVSEFIWAKDGLRLALVVSRKDGAREGVYLFNSSDAQTLPLALGAGFYKHLRFDESGLQLAFVSNRDDLLAQKTAAKKPVTKATTEAEAATEAATEVAPEAAPEAKTAPDAGKDAAAPDTASFNLFYWRDGQAEAQVVVSPNSAAMPPGWGPSEFATLHFSKDGQRLFFGTASLPKPAPKNATEPVKVDIWHWKDPELQSMQKVKLEKEKQRSYDAVWHVASRRMVQLGSKDRPDIITNENRRFALGLSDLPYQRLQSWDNLYYDAWAVDLESGTVRLLAKKLRFKPTLSPAGKYMLAFDANSHQWWSWSMQDGVKTNLTGGLKVSFEDHRRNIPGPRPSWGFAGWRKDDGAVVLYDQFDLWQVNPANRATSNLTQGYGRKNQLSLRFIDLDDEHIKKKMARPINEDEAEPPENNAMPDTPWILGAKHEQTHASGFFQLDHGNSSAEPRKLIYADKMIGDLIKAKNADTVLFTQQSFTEFPDLWHSDLALQSPQKISQANPQQASYNWGRQELFHYTSADGKKLQALLTKPENFDPAKKYPLMVYIYEKFSDSLHKHIVPAPRQNINVTRYVSNGYIVLRPDIVYQIGYPGKSALDTVVPAIKQLSAKGYINPARIGIQGHSWGGYQINYLLTRTKLFRAAQAGAGLGNMISGYGGIRWGTGMSRAFQYEQQQSRIGGTPWDSRDKYIENSPIFQVDKITTPYLTLHNDEDDAVPWYQAIEFFTALRRLDKPAWWFNYNGEKHGLKERDNMKHFTVHRDEFFDHYLQDKARPEWMDTPTPYLEKGKREVMGQFKPVAQ